MNSRRPKPVITASDDAEVGDFLKALAALSACAMRIAGLNRRTILKGLGALDHDAEQRLARMLKLMDDIQRSFMRIRRRLENEWPAMRGVFGDEFLVELLGIAASSIRRYASGERATPDEVGARLHWLAMVVADLAGAYNDFGIRRWFARPRSQLEGRSPRQTLDAGWRPEDAAADRLRALAAVLT